MQTNGSQLASVLQFVVAFPIGYGEQAQMRLQAVSFAVWAFVHPLVTRSTLQMQGELMELQRLRQQEQESGEDWCDVGLPFWDW